MSDGLDEFVRGSLAEMNYPVADAADDTPLGPDGLDVDSLARVEFGLRTSDTYGVELSDDEVRVLAGLTIGQLVALLRGRIRKS